MKDAIWNSPKFYDFEGYLRTVNNNKMDVDGFIDSEYGNELARRLKIRHQIENDRVKAKEYYLSIGLTKEFINYDDYFNRYSLLIPVVKANEKLPVVFYLHGMGNSIEAEENMNGFSEIASKEGFILCSPQNTNPDNVIKILKEIKSKYLIDESRVYLAGFSQGAEQLQALSIRYPDVFAACVTSGNEVFRPWDNFDIDYTQEELEKYKRLRVPIMQISGECEPFPYAPLNVFNPPCRFKPKWGGPDSFEGKNKDMSQDPTRVFVEVIDENGEKKLRPKMARHYLPNENEDSGIWNLNRLNTRLSMLNCPNRDINLCMSYKELGDRSVKKMTGIYGDYEARMYYYGYAHYIASIDDYDGNEMYSFVVVENSPHWPQLMMGKLGWSFLKKYHRDEISKEIKVEK